MAAMTYIGKQSKTYLVSMHKHPELEIIYCTRGDGVLKFEDDSFLRYVSGDILIVPPETPHMNSSENGFKNIHLQLFGLVPPYKSPVKIADGGGVIKQLLKQLIVIPLSEMKNKNTIVQNYIELILNLLLGMADAERYSEQVENIKNKLIENFGDCYFDVSAYLDSLPSSSEYLRKLFAQETGLSPVKYLTKIRLENAQKLLNIRPNDPNRLKIKEISEMCGFLDPLYFSKVFKKHYGYPPKSC
ncbi:MAG: helix-turn-helix domain-containing protein [Clostridiales bacterium]|nr:helix-turn-helix domain-containing protein [Clostridiales bacterium]